MKKILAIALAALMLLSLAACGTKEETKTDASQTDAAKETEAAAQTDTEYVKEKGELIIGVTDFAPMDYMEDGRWVGFDADMAKAFAEYLGVSANIVEISWDAKIMELDAKNIDCVWNGMTLTDDVKAAMETSNAYCNNAQVVVMPADVSANYAGSDDCMELTFAVEAGSAGEAMAQEYGFNYISVEDQARALMEVASGTSDACIIDLLMADAMIGEGTSYTDLVYSIELNSEEYGVGFRKGSDLAQALNDFFAQSYADGTMQTIAKQYGVAASLIEQ